MKQGYVIKLCHINTGEIKYVTNYNNLTDDVRWAEEFKNENGAYINHRLNQLHHLNNYTYEIVPVASELGTYLKTTELGKKVDKAMLIMKSIFEPINLFLSPILIPIVLIPIALIVVRILKIKEWIKKLYYVTKYNW